MRETPVGAGILLERPRPAGARHGGDLMGKTIVPKEKDMLEYLIKENDRRLTESRNYKKILEELVLRESGKIMELEHQGEKLNKRLEETCRKR